MQQGKCCISLCCTYTVSYTHLAGRQVLLNLVNKTTIPQLGALLKSCAVLIRADTGTAHVALALDVPVVDVFYLNDESNLAAWGPKTCLLYTSRCV